MYIVECVYLLLTGGKKIYTIATVVVIQVTTEWIAPYLQTNKEKKTIQEV